jgi:4-amino-4-deoxy-L-arabinose transferase-like glycosyltransferase
VEHPGLKTRGARRGKAILRWIDAHPAAAVFSVALVLRLACLLWLNEEPYAQGGDGPHYLSIARDLLEGRPYGSTIGDPKRVPLYQVLLAAHLWVFGGFLVAVAVTQAVIGSVTAVILTRTAEEVTSVRRPWLVGMLWATYPPAILNTVVIFPQPLQVLWLAGAFYTLLIGVNRRSLAWCGFAALLWGAGCLTREGNLFFLPVFAAAPLLLWRSPRWSLRWALRASVIMFVSGAASVLWWTAADFPATRRLEDLVSNNKERRALALIAARIEPWADRLVVWRYLPGDGRVHERLSDEDNTDEVKDAERIWRFELRRLRIKIWQTFSAPDGCVQLRCSAQDSGGFWAGFRSRVVESPIGAVGQALSRPCLLLKSFMYIEHYLLILLALPAFVFLRKRAPGFTLFLVLYLGYTVVAIVFGSNYSQTLAAVPRYAFSVMPVPVLIVGLLLSGFRLHHPSRTSAVAPGFSPALQTRWQPGAPSIHREGTECR